MEPRAFYACIYCGNPVSPERWEHTRTCDGPCVGRLATVEEVSARTVEQSGEFVILLPKCSQCELPMSIRSDGLVPDMCYGCSKTGKMLSCENPRHSGSRMTQERWINYFAKHVHNPKSRDHGKTLKVRYCLKCGAGLETWEQYSNRKVKEGIAGKRCFYGSEFIEPDAPELFLTTSPWDVCGGLKNAWKPKRGAAGIGSYTFFKPIRYVRIEGVYTGTGESKRELWVLMSERLSRFGNSDKTETFIGSIVHMAVNETVRDIYRPRIVTKQHFPKSHGFLTEPTRTLKNERRQVMEVQDIGWCFAGVRGADGNAHVIRFYRYADHTMHWPNHSVKEWAMWCMDEFRK